MATTRLMHISGKDWLKDTIRNISASPDSHDFGSVSDDVFISNVTKVYRYETAFDKSNFTGDKIITLDARLYYVPQQGASYDLDFMIYKTSDSGGSGRFVRLVFANGYGSGEVNDIAVTYNNSEYWAGKLLDETAYNNKWTNVKIKLFVENSVLTKGEAYLDGTKVSEKTSFSIATNISTFFGNDTAKIRFIAFPDCRVDYIDLSVSDNAPITANGGGATHIAKVTGQLSSLSNNLSDILMVSGGGGGGLIIGEDTYAGKDAGGIAGSGNNSANQTTGYAFGQGESADGVSGGGGGLYGGYKGVNS